MSGELELVRDGVSSVSPTLGELLIEGVHEAFTLEDPWLQNQKDISCVPTGTYGLVLTLSARFGREMPRLLGVPGRVGILIHLGNVQADTHGCILVGDKRIGEDLLNSKAAFERFLSWFASVGNETQITIRNRDTGVGSETF